MERGSAKHGPRQDEALADELAGELGPGGSNREEWKAAEPPADDDPPERTGSHRAQDPGTAGARNQDEAEMRRLRHDMEVANDWNPACDDL
jgi:hypothetical protein